MKLKLRVCKVKLGEMAGVGEMMRSVFSRGSNGGQFSMNSEGEGNC
jgi:hypothetical protein